MLSPSDTALVFLLALLLFGPEQLPRIARQLGEAMRHMQSTTHTFMNEMERAARVNESDLSEIAAEPHDVGTGAGESRATEPEHPESEAPHDAQRAPGEGGG